MSGATDALRDALVDIAGSLNADRDRARNIAEICDQDQGEEWLTDPQLRSFGLIGPDGERPQVVGVEVAVVSGGEYLELTVVVEPVAGMVAGWLDLDLMPYIGAVSLRGGSVLVHI